MAVENTVDMEGAPIADQSASLSDVSVLREEPRHLPSWDEVRKEREAFLTRQTSLQSGAETQKQSSGEALRAIQDALSGILHEKESLVSKEKTLAEQHEELNRQKREWQTQRQDPLKDIAPLPIQRKNEEFRSAIENEGRLLGREQDQRRRRLERWTRRVENWRRAWENRLAQDKDKYSKDLEALQDENQKIRALWEKEKADRAERERFLQREQERLRLEQEKFQQEMVEPWHRERADAERRWESLRQQQTRLEQDLRALQTRRSEEQALFERSAAEQRRSTREQQRRWREQVKTQAAAFSQQITASSEELQAARQSYENEKASVENTAAARRQIANGELSVLEEGKTEFRDRASLERDAWLRRLAETAAGVAELEKQKAGVESALEARIREHARLTSERRSWADKRFETLQRVLEQIRKNSAERLEKLQLEKESLRSVLRRERSRFRETLENTEKDFQGKRADLVRSQEQLEKDHVAFLAQAKKEEEAKQGELAQLRESVSALEKKFSLYQDRENRQWIKQKERYERVLLNMRQKADQEQVTGEARLAQEKMELESLRKRVLYRESRLDKLVQRRREALEKLFQEAEESLEVVRQSRWRETRSWSERLRELGIQRERLLTTEAELQKAQDPREFEKRKQELAEQFEMEKARLSREAEEYWKSFLEKSAANQKGLQQAYSRLREMSADLERQETSVQEFLAHVENQAAHLRSLRDHFRSLGLENRQGASRPSVA